MHLTFFHKYIIISNILQVNIAKIYYILVYEQFFLFLLNCLYVKVGVLEVILYLAASHVLVALEMFLWSSNFDFLRHENSIEKFNKNLMFYC